MANISALEVLLADSARIEQAMAGVCVLVAAALFLRVVKLRRGSPARPTAPADSLTVRAEITLLILVLLGAAAVRTVGYAGEHQPQWWFSQVTALWLDRMLHRGGLLAQWLQLVQGPAQGAETTQLSWTHTSALMLPVAALFQVALGPSFHLPLLIGCFWALLTIAAAWFVGRAMVSRSFGVCFAAFIAASPLQIAWSRIGTIVLGAGLHVLCVLWLCHRALAGGRVRFALFAAVAAWATLYNYLAARMAIPLAMVAMAVGHVDERVPIRRRVWLTTVFLLAFGLLVAAPWGADMWKVLWPRYPDAVGSRGERTLGELAASAALLARVHGPSVLESYFWARRAAPPGKLEGMDWGMASGGLCFVPVTLLGLVGLLATLKAWRRRLVWLAFAVMSLAIPCLSGPTARRLLVFDIAWCALASFGVLTLLRSPWLAGLSPRALRLAMGTFFVTLGAWAFTTVTALDAALPADPRAVIPLAESGFGDGRTCLGCMKVAEEWRNELARNTVVVLFDADPERENRTSPAGLAAYAKLAALQAERPGHFIDYYALAQNYDVEPPLIGPVYDPWKTDARSFLASRVESAQAEEILWHFERPTQWERWLADRLAAGGAPVVTLERPSLVALPWNFGDMPLTPLGLEAGEHPIQVRTAWPQRREKIEAVAELVESTPPGSDCIRLERIRTDAFDQVAFLLEGHGEKGAVSEWAVASVNAVWYRGAASDSFAPVVLAWPSASDELHVLSRYGTHHIHERGSVPTMVEASPGSAPIGRNCAALVGGAWWMVDPVSGRLSTSGLPASPLPEGRWVGVARDGEYRLVLAGADQEITVMDMRSGKTVRKFPAVVPPSRHLLFGECAQVAAGDGWVATFNPFSAGLHIYDIHDASGTELAAVDLARVLGLQPREITAVRGTGEYVGVAHGINPGLDTGVTTFQVVRLPSCPGESEKRTPPTTTKKRTRSG